MRQIAENLKSQVYIDVSNVEAIRKYIRVKNPDCTDKVLSAVFADALHKVIDARIYQFEEKHRKRIKDAVLKKAVAKSEFSINAAEVFSSCLAMKLHDDSYIQSFTQWINQSQPIAVSAAEVDLLVTKAEQYDENEIEDNLDSIIDVFEESWAEDKTFEVLEIDMDSDRELMPFEAAAVTPSDIHDEIVDNEESRWIEEIMGFVQAYEPEAVEEAAISAVEPLDENIPVAAPAVSDQEGIRENQVPYTDIAPVNSQHSQLMDKLTASMKHLAGAARENFKYLKPSMKLALSAAVPAIVLMAVLISGLTGVKVQELKYKDVGRYAVVAEDQVDRYLTLESRMLEKLDGMTGERNLIFHDGLHGEFRFEEVDGKKLRKWLEDRNSMLAEEPYFTAILDTSRKYDIHPVLMFAIVGQEQGFVPRDGAAARRIANNPFNVYGSWEKYNTDIYDSSRLAASTIIESSRNRPAYMNTIRWINRRYAEDPNWWNGVSSLFAQIKREMTN